MNRSKIKGTSWEAGCEDESASWGGSLASTKRLPLSGAKDVGDLNAPFVIECKNEREYHIGPWLAETVKEISNSVYKWGVCWFHLKGKGKPIDGAILMTPRSFRQLLSEAGYCNAEDGSPNDVAMLAECIRAVVPHDSIPGEAATRVLRRLGYPI